VVLQHAAHEGPGAIGSVLDDIGVEWRCCRLDRGEPVPGPRAADALAGVVAMGGPMSVHDEDSYPWLVDERRLLVAMAEAGRTVLGVCLGAQQLALALGAEVYEGPGPEIGAGAVNLTTAGLDDPVLGPAGNPLPCVHWHGDTFTLPPDAVLLASSPAYAHQAFRLGSSVYVLQFHVEVDEGLADAWAPELPPGVFLRPDHVAAVASVGRPLLERLFSRG
jgi:GMP synthase-like glutamine amidotransferase